MPDAPITITDANIDSVLNGDQPTLLLFTSGEGLRSDFKAAYDKAAQEAKGKIVYARVDPGKFPELAKRFGVGEKPVLVAWYCGEEVARRQKPWGTDLPLAIEMLQKAVSENSVVANSPIASSPIPTEAETEVEEKPVTQPVVLTKPVNVTDATFEEEVLNSDLPVLVDFWAAWCGPCRMVAPILEKLAGEFAGQIKIAKVDTDANPALSQAFRIQSIPNLMIVKQRTMIFNQPGALPENALRDLIQQAIALEIPPQNQAQQAAQQQQQQPQAK